MAVRAAGTFPRSYRGATRTGILVFCLPSCKLFAQQCRTHGLHEGACIIIQYLSKFLECARSCAATRNIVIHKAIHSCVSLGKSLLLSEPRFPRLENWEASWNYTCFLFFTAHIQSVDKCCWFYC